MIQHQQNPTPINARFFLGCFLTASSTLLLAACFYLNQTSQALLATPSLLQTVANSPYGLLLVVSLLITSIFLTCALSGETRSNPGYFRHGRNFNNGYQQYPASFFYTPAPVNTHSHNDLRHNQHTHGEAVFGNYHTHGNGGTMPQRHTHNDGPIGMPFGNYHHSH